MGVLAVYGVPDASTYIYYGLHNLQHRGQEGGGIATSPLSTRMGTPIATGGSAC